MTYLRASILNGALEYLRKSSPYTKIAVQTKTKFTIRHFGLRKRYLSVIYIHSYKTDLFLQCAHGHKIHY